MKHAAFETESEALLLVNPSANRGRAERVAEEVRAVLTANGLSVEQISPENVASTRKVATAAMRRDARVVAVGGDGLIHHVVQGAAEKPVCFGIVPAGTGNDFATALGIPTAPSESALTAMQSPVPVDVLRMTDSLGQARYGATIATAGFSAAVNIRAEQLVWPRGPSRYTAATLIELVRLPRYHVDLKIDGHEHEGTCLLVAVANTSLFGGGMKIAPSASPASGSAEVVLIHDTSALTLLRVLPKTFSGNHVSHPSVQILRGNEIELSLTPVGNSEPCELRCDGEPVGSLPQSITVVPGGLQIAGATVAGGSS